MSECPFSSRPVVRYIGQPMPPMLISCPTCGRCSNPDFFQRAKEVQQALIKANRPDLKVAVMGCSVNGPGEAKDADCGVFFGEGRAAIYRKGKLIASVSTEDAIPKLLEVISYTW